MTDPHRRIPKVLKTKTSRVLAALANRRGHSETSTDHVQATIQVLENVLEFGALDEEDRRDVRLAVRRLWSSIREFNRGNT